MNILFCKDIFIIICEYFNIKELVSLESISKSDQKMIRNYPWTNTTVFIQNNKILDHVLSNYQFKNFILYFMCDTNQYIDKLKYSHKLDIRGIALTNDNLLKLKNCRELNMLIQNDVSMDYTKRLIKLFDQDKISEEIITYDNTYYNIIIIDAYTTDICGIGYLVFLSCNEYFMHTYSLIHNSKIATDFGTCINYECDTEYSYIKNIDNSTMCNIFYQFPLAGDMIRHINILNHFDTNYDYQIQITFCSDKLDDIDFGMVNTQSIKTITLDKYLSMIGLCIINMGRSSCIKITIDKSKISDWNRLHYCIGFVYLNTELRNKIRAGDGLYPFNVIEKN